MSEEQPVAAVEEQDREAAAWYCREQYGTDTKLEKLLLAGEQDNTPLVQVFARYGRAAEQFLRELVERARRDVVLQLARDAHQIGWQAGVGGMETAGAIVSYLARCQNQIEPYFAGEVSPVDWPDFIDGGCLTWHASKDGKLVYPTEARAARTAFSAQVTAGESK